MDHMDANLAYWEKAWQQFHKNATSNIEQILGTTYHKQQLYRHQPPISKTKFEEQNMQDTAREVRTNS